MPRTHAHRGAGVLVGQLSWWTAAFGLAVHSLVGGVALAERHRGRFRGTQGVGRDGLGRLPGDGCAQAGGCHDDRQPDAPLGGSSRLAHLVNLGFAVMIPLGVALFTLGLGTGLGRAAPRTWTAVALSFSAGTFLCIALSDLLPELQFHSHDRLKLSLALLAGFFLMAGTSAIEYF